MKWRHILKIFILILFILILLLLIIRYFFPRYLDDLHPSIPCEENLIKKSDYLAVIPKYNNKSISDNKEWCNYIKSFNKSLVMHGVYHTYNEFGTLRDFDYIQEGRDIFFDCFDSNPTEFKAPQLILFKDNKKILKERFNFKVHTRFTQIFHKVYHCTDSGFFSNRIQDLI